MNRQQLTELADELIEGEPLAWEHTGNLPPTIEDSDPHEGLIIFKEGQFELDLTIWSGYHHDPATQYQPAEEGWADRIDLFVRSPFLTDLLGELEDREIAVPWTPL